MTKYINFLIQTQNENHYMQHAMVFLNSTTNRYHAHKVQHCMVS